MIKILIGGSPCTFWSIAQKKNRETTAEGLGWELFKNYLIAKEKFKPDFFLYENNWSAAAPIKEQIQTELGVQLMRINSALVSAQNRDRFYCFNWRVDQPQDRGILISDILDSGEDLCGNEKSYCLTASYAGAAPYNTIERAQRTMVAEPVQLSLFDLEEPKPPEPAAVNLQVLGRQKNEAGEYERVFEARTDGKSSTLTETWPRRLVAEPVIAQRGHGYNKGGIKTDKAPTLTANGSYQHNNFVVQPVAVACRNRREEDGKLYRRPETSNSTKANALTTVQTDSMVGIPINTTKNGKAGALRGSDDKIGVRNLIANTRDRRTCVAEPIRIGTVESTAKNKQSKQYRVYSPDRKSTTLCGQGGGMGAKTGLYATPASSSKVPNIYTVKDGKIEIKGRLYPIKLADGDYIIRKLTPIECERLQTLPDGYTAAVSNAQRYKGLGNGWTAEVIIHILRGALEAIPRNEEIVVLSMYDGIGTGRYCLDKMGFTNVKYYAYEIDKFAIKVAQSNYPDIIELGDAFTLRRPDWELGKKFEEVKTQ